MSLRSAILLRLENVAIEALERMEATLKKSRDDNWEMRLSDDMLLKHCEASVKLCLDSSDEETVSKVDPGLAEEARKALAKQYAPPIKVVETEEEKENTLQ